MGMKVAVSVPDAVFEAADRLARERGVPRSQVFTEALRDYVERHGAQGVTARLNEVYAREGSDVVPALRGAQYAVLDDEAW